MSSFVHNLARRGAGLEPIATVRPPFVPNFAPGLPIRLWRPTPSLVGGVRETRELPHPTTGLRAPVPKSDQEAGQEMPPTRVSASEQVSSPVASSLPPHPPGSDPESPGLPPQALDERTDGQPFTQHSPAQPRHVAVADKSREREPRLSDQDELQQRSQRPMMTLHPDRIPAGPRVGSSSEDQTVPGSWSAPEAQSLPNKGPADSSRVLSPSQDAQEQYAPTIRAARQTEEGSDPEPADNTPSRSSVGSSPEVRAAFEPGRAPVTQSSSPAWVGSARIRVRSAEEATEQYAPVVRTGAARQTVRGSDPEAGKTIQQASPTQRGEPLGEAEPGPVPLRPVQPLPGEPAAQPAPRPLAQVAPAPVASSVTARQASVIRPQPTQPAVLPPLQRPAAQPEQDSIHVRIGTVEVRATTPPSAPTPVPQGFGDYASVRSYAGWEKT